MPLPQTIRVKLSSEAAEYVSVTQVVMRDMPVRELVELMLGITGKDETRLCELLLRGTLVSGGSRFRWTGWTVAAEDLREILGTFPDADPTRTFDAGLCSKAVLLGGRRTLEITREAGERKPLLGRLSFWDVLMGVAKESALAYRIYSYREQADCYRAEITWSLAERLRDAARLLRYTQPANEIRLAPPRTIDLFVRR